jgi:hypothetical protein
MISTEREVLTEVLTDKESRQELAPVEPYPLLSSFSGILRNGCGMKLIMKRRL